MVAHNKPDTSDPVQRKIPENVTQNLEHLAAWASFELPIYRKTCLK
jgi:hypothetical protein